MAFCFLNSFMFMAHCLHTCGSLTFALLSFLFVFYLDIIEINLNFCTFKSTENLKDLWDD